MIIFCSVMNLCQFFITIYRIINKYLDSIPSLTGICLTVYGVCDEYRIFLSP